MIFFQRWWNALSTQRTLACAMGNGTLTEKVQERSSNFQYMRLRAENFRTSKTCQKSERKLHCEAPNHLKRSISPQISGRVESLRLNASASVSIWYAKVDPTIVSFWCYHVATCFAVKLCAWHVVPQHKGCNKIGNRRPNLCTWLEEGFHRTKLIRSFSFGHRSQSQDITI